jgi:hypothetical protein
MRGKQPLLNELPRPQPTSALHRRLSDCLLHSVRLLKEANRSADARAMLDKILAGERQQLNARL